MHALTLRMSGEQIYAYVTLRVPPNFFSESTAGSRRRSDSEFQTVGPATENVRVPKVLLLELIVDDFWQIAHAGDQELRRLAHSSRRTWSCVVLKSVHVVHHSGCRLNHEL